MSALSAYVITVDKTTGVQTVETVDAQLFGYETLVNRPAGTAVGDIFVVLDVANQWFRWDIYDGTGWRQLESKKSNRTAVANPTVNDDAGDGYDVGSIWVNTATDTIYICADSTVGAAVWVNVSTGGGDVTGPAGSEVYGIARFADATGKVIEDSQVRMYGELAADPVPGGGVPAPTDGDLYYNTVLKKLMAYDGTRAKWLSVESNTIQVGNNGNVPVGTYFKGIAGQTLSATSGYTAEWNGTVVSISWTRGDADLAQFNVMANGVEIDDVNSNAVSGYDNTLDGDFSQGDILAVENDGGGNAVQTPQIWVKFKWRAT